MKKYIIISGLNLKDNNRGTAALSYGSISFLKKIGYFKKGDILLNIRYYKNPLKKEYRKLTKETLTIDREEIIIHTKYISIAEKFLLMKFGFIPPFSSLYRISKSVKCVAAINGGDGFSDIYNTKTFLMRLPESLFAIKKNIPLIELPQTYGPFKHPQNLQLAKYILTHAEKVYVRDTKFNVELNKMKINYELTKDLSFFMQPEPFKINIEPNSIGINVSGLAYSNKFQTLSNQFTYYPLLISSLIYHFQRKGHTVYLIPHSYHFGTPEINNDDLDACKKIYESLENKSNIKLINQDLISPQIKYIISKMSFFIGTRMHANFAAIYTNVPVFGLAYSYKFEGAFNANGLDGKLQTVMINNIKKEDINPIIDKIEIAYKRLLLKKSLNEK